MPKTIRFAAALVQHVSFGRIKGGQKALTWSQMEKISSIMALLEGIMLPCAEKINSIIASEFGTNNRQEDWALIHDAFSDEIVSELRNGNESITFPSVVTSALTRGVDGQRSSSNKREQNETVSKVMLEFSDAYGVSLEPTQVEKKLSEIFGLETNEDLAGMKTRREEKIKGQFSRNALDVPLLREDLDFFYQCKAEIQPQIKCLTSAFQSIRQAELYKAYPILRYLHA